MTLEERIKQMLAESEKEDTVAEELFDGKHQFASAESYIEEETAVNEEQIDELSKSTIGSYLKKSAKDVARNSYDVYHSSTPTGAHSGDSDVEARNKKALKTAQKRLNGMDKAVTKIASESEDLDEEQIDELSKSTLGSYIKRAGNSLAVNAYNANREYPAFVSDAEDKKKKSLRAATNRMGGIDKAADKITKESEDQSTVSDQVSALLEAEGLSEDFKLQAVTIFEAAVSDRVMQIEEELKQEYQEALDEATAEMEKNIDGFMSEAIQQWMIDNKLAVETNFKHKLQESFIDGLTALLAEHNIELPAESENALDVALDQITSLEESIESASAREAELMEQIADMKATSILESFRSKMPATTFDRFVQLTENINYTDEAQYARQLDIVYENFGKVTAVVESAPARQITESIAQPAVAEDLNESVEFYAQYMSK
jgi:hypothetical protein